MLNDGYQFQSSMDSADFGDLVWCIMVQLVRWHHVNVDIAMIDHCCMLVGHVESFAIMFTCLTCFDIVLSCFKPQCTQLLYIIPTCE